MNIEERTMKMLYFIENLALNSDEHIASYDPERSQGNGDDQFRDGYDQAVNSIGIKAKNLLKEIHG